MEEVVAGKGRKKTNDRAANGRAAKDLAVLAAL
jgi:hypothetical protein